MEFEPTKSPISHSARTLLDSSAYIRFDNSSKGKTTSHHLSSTPRLPVVLVVDPEIVFVEQLQQDASQWNLHIQAITNAAVIQENIQRQIQQETLKQLC
jgi:hypothetical protein